MKVSEPRPRAAAATFRPPLPETAMQCPECANQLTTITYEGARVHTCIGCGGEFIGGVELATIINRREERFCDAVLGETVEREPVHGVPEVEARCEMDCPACATPMRTLNYGVDTGVYVERCDGCGGVWLDHDELEHVQAVMERWTDEAPERLRAAAGELEAARHEAASRAATGFNGSRFAFVNAVINRLLDAA